MAVIYHQTQLDIKVAGKAYLEIVKNAGEVYRRDKI
jgi:hypothetical protein